jgi:hypothetical protein
LYTDPNGQEYLVCDPNGKNCGRVDDEDFYKDRKNLEGGGLTFTGDRDFFEHGQIRDGDGNVVASYVQISIDDPVRQNIFAIRSAVSPIPKATLAFFGLSLAGGGTGGALYYVLTPATTVTTLGIAGQVSAPATGLGALILNQLSRMDAAVLQRAIDLGARASNSFRQNVSFLSRATTDNIPGGKVNLIGRIGTSPVFGSLVSRVGIAEVNGATVVVKMVNGQAQVIGPLP